MIKTVPNLTSMESRLNRLLATNIQPESPLAHSNIQMFSEAIRGQKQILLSLTFKPAALIVESGRLSLNHPEYDYSQVPLGIILHGQITVIKDGKATKQLSAGDFIGQFETADWLQFDRTRHLGDWTLQASSLVEILFLNKQILLSSQAINFRSYLIEQSRKDPVPQPVTNMSLLDWTAVHTTHSDFSEFAVVAHTHLLPSNLPLFRHLAHLVGPHRMFIMEKPYSTTPKVINSLVEAGCEIVPVNLERGSPYAFAVQKSIQMLWSAIIEDYKRGLFSKLLILDDGGDLWLSIPHEQIAGLSIAGVEQTQRGATRIKERDFSDYPVIGVSSCGVKKIIESDFIGRSVVLRLKEAGHLPLGTRIGVLGAGSIGTSVIETALELGYHTLVYDPQHAKLPQGPKSITTLDTLLNQSDIIIGTTGTNALRGTALNRVVGHKKLASASSADIEFFSLLHISRNIKDPLGDIKVKVREDLEFEILNGGFPFNFDRKGNASYEEDIVLTRCLLYAGMMQAREALEKKLIGGLYNLDTTSQSKILSAWLSEKVKANDSVREIFKNIDNIVHSNIFENPVPMKSIWKD
jgi:S-adenosylhomocysteine hydrolase